LFETISLRNKFKFIAHILDDGEATRNDSKWVKRALDPLPVLVTKPHRILYVKLCACIRRWKMAPWGYGRTFKNLTQRTSITM